jgi:hypothetical protein
MLRRFTVQVLCLVLSWPTVAFAARPFMTDDARLTTAGSCQLESWTRRYADRSEFWALPACNPTGHWEITAGGSSLRGADQAHSTDAVVQIKTLFKTMPANGWGAGVALGHLRHRSHELAGVAQGQTYLYLPVSVSFGEGRWVTHANVGWSRDRASGQDQLTWGMGLETQLHQRWLWIGETFGNDRQKPFWQTGLRYQVVPDRFQIDATWGAPQGFRSAQNWLSFGLRWTPEKFP